MYQEKKSWERKNSKKFLLFSTIFIIIPTILFIIALFNAATASKKFGSASSRNSSDKPKEFLDVGVEEKLGNKVSIDTLSFIDENGNSVLLSKYFKPKKPMILLMGYYECPKLCSLVFNALSVGARQLEWSIGHEYDVLTVSVNAKEGPELAKIKKHNYVKNYGRMSAKEGWHFLTGGEASIKKLADEVGFKYKYDPRIEQYAHAAVLIFLTPEGKVSRYLYGIDFSHNNLKLALVEASEGTIGNIMEQLLLYCFHYDPDSQSYSLTVFFLMQIGGGLTLLAILFFIGKFWWKELRKKKSKKIQ